MRLVQLGRLLRARGSHPDLRRELRAALPGVFAEAGAATVEDSLARLSGELTVLLSELELRRSQREPAGAERVLSLALLRDDLESIRYALAAVRFQSSTAGRELLDPLVWMLDETRAIADRFDGAVSPMAAWLRRTLREATVPAPPELLAMVSAGSNPWWLDLVDPSLSRLAHDLSAALARLDAGDEGDE